MVDIKVFTENAQAICCEVTDLRLGSKFHFTAVYGYNTVDLRKHLWKFIEEISRRINGRKMFSGDFNSVLEVDDRFQGNPITENETKDFEKCIKDNDLNSVRIVGSYYKWCNNQEKEDRVLSKIDRCLVNTEWMNMFHDVIVEVLDKSVSDHCPMLIDMKLDIIKRKAPFRFLNVLAQMEEFYSKVKETWKVNQNRNCLLNILYKLKNLKEHLKKINIQYFKVTAQKVSEIRERLMITQCQLNQDLSITHLIEAEKKLLQDLEKWSMIEEQIRHQKSRADWISMGDSNTKYLHAYTKERNNQTMKILVKSEGSKCETQDQKKEEIVDFLF